MRNHSVWLLAALGIILILASFGSGFPLVASQGPYLLSAYISSPLPSSPDSKQWEHATPVVIPLGGQVVTDPKLPDPSVTSARVRSLHDGTDIAFLLEWEDSTKNDYLAPGTFRDAAALAFPLGEAPPPLCMGQPDRFVNIWHWKADHQAAVDAWEAQDRKRDPKRPKDCFREDRLPGPCLPLLIFPPGTPVEEWVGGGLATLTAKRHQGLVRGKGVYQHERWQVLFKRSMATSEEYSESFQAGRRYAIGFAVWNGGAGERGAQKAVGSWIQFQLAPLSQSIE